jgi:hypothetical protein
MSARAKARALVENGVREHVSALDGMSAGRASEDEPIGKADDTARVAPRANPETGCLENIIII